jgi:hypothetical protein
MLMCQASGTFCLSSHSCCSHSCFIVCS